MTATERNYRKYLGKLYWSTNRGSLVTIEAVKRSQYGNRWKFDIFYMNANVGQQTRKIDCVRIANLIKEGTWIPADQYIKNPPPAVKLKVAEKSC
jgi:hypothetical protein